MIKLTKTERENLRLLDNTAFRPHINSVSITEESLDHFMTKSIISYERNKGGSNIVTEARFKGGLRADIFIISDSEIVEIIDSEPDESILKKKEFYEKLGLKFTAIDVIRQNH